MLSLNNIKLAVVLFLLSPFCFAIDPNSTQAIEIESDTASLDDQSGVSIYSGNVIVSQGLSRLEADQIHVNTADRQITTISASGQPAHFVQQDGPASPSTHGYGNTITFIAKDNLVRFSGSAKLVQNENSFSGEEIEYDILKRAIRAKGDESQGSRVKIHYYPQPNKSTPTDVAPPDSNSTKSDPSHTQQANQSDKKLK